MVILETDRLILRVFEQNDLEYFAAIEADPEVMKYYASGPRSRKQTARNIGWFIELQEQLGHSLWAVIHKHDNRFIGCCGLLPQTVHGNVEFEIAYKFEKNYWGQGIATEAARAVRDWGFTHLDTDRLISIIAPENVGSIRVAEKNGMSLCEMLDYHGMTCSLYAIERPK